MDIHLPKLYKDYGDYSNYRNFPLNIDGLKPVERRVLLSAFKIAKNSFVKSRQVDAYTIGHYHPHGECYGTIVQMVRQGFLTGQGNFGTNIGIEPVGPAAPRYTECKMNPVTIDLMFKYINYVPMIDTELSDKEPFYLPTMFPVCLMGREYTQGIGFGYKTYIPCYDIRDLYQRLLWLLKIRKRKPIIAPLTDCLITSPPNILDDLTKNGNARIEVKGIFDIDKRKNEAILRSWPPIKRFQSLLNKFSKELNENMIGFTDLSVAQTEIVFKVLRERNRDKIFKEFIEKLDEVIKGIISFEVVLIDSDQKVVKESIDNMLLNTFSMYLDANEKMLRDEISKINETIEEYKLLEVIRKPLSECISAGYDIEDTAQEILNSTGVEKRLTRFIVDKYKIKKLLSLDTDTVDLEKKVKDFETKLKNINDFVLKQYNGTIK